MGSNLRHVVDFFIKIKTSAVEQIHSKTKKSLSKFVKFC